MFKLEKKRLGVGVEKKGHNCYLEFSERCWAEGMASFCGGPRGD